MKILYITNKNKNKELRGFFSYFKNHCDIDYLWLESVKDEDVAQRAVGCDVVMVQHNKQIKTLDFWKKVVGDKYFVWWINDERYPPEPWRLQFGAIVDLFFVASHDSVDILSDCDIGAQYLIMGYKKRPLFNYERKIYVCFTGQNSDESFPLSCFRQSLISFVKNCLKDYFKVYGAGWKFADAVKVSPSIYHNVKIGLQVGHYNTRGTYSNRMLQIMGHGAMCLAHRSYGLDDIFKDGEHLVYFDNQEDCVEKAKYYLKNDSERLAIANSGRMFIEQNHVWEVKAKQILDCLVERLKK